MRPPRPWAAAVFVVALAARLLFTFLADQPLLYGHQYHYFHSGLALSQHPSPVSYVLFSDEWRTWNGEWTVAPLYHLFLGVMFRLFGPHLVPLRVVQSVLDALAAVAVAALGRRAAGPRGAWAGVAYALWWPAIEMPSWTMTENLHTVLFAGSFALLAEEAELPSRRRAFAGGLLLGLSALARAVSTGFLPIAAIWRWWVAGRGRAGLRAAAPILVGGAIVIFPWTARNVFLVKDAVLIESAAFENIWFANNFAEPPRLARQREVIHGEKDPAERRRAALLFAARGIRRHPDLFVEKVGVNFWHFLRPEGLHSLVRVQRSLEPWRHAGSALLDDVLLIGLVPLAIVFVVAGPRSPVRVLLAGWMAYYLLMVVVIFHNEVRYRSAFVPFALAAAAGGVAVLCDRDRRRRLATWAGLALGLVIVVRMLRPYAREAWQDAAATRMMAGACRALERGAPAEAWGLAEAAAARAPRSARPWYDLGKALHFSGDLRGAVAAYAKGDPRGVFANWRGMLGRARILPALGDEGGLSAVREADRTSWQTDPWLVLEMAWRELPPPRTDEVLVARNDYGAVRGFFHPRGLDAGVVGNSSQWNAYSSPDGPRPPPGPHRWTRRRAWVRLVPTEPAAAYDVTIEMGAPFPSPVASPVVTVRGNDGAAHAFTLGPAVQPHTFRIAATPGEAVLLGLDSPVWSRAGEPADQGVRVDRVTVRAAP